MSALAFLIPTSLVLGLIGLGCFVWSLRSRQYDDLDGAAARILLDDETDGPPADPVRTPPGAASEGPQGHRPDEDTE